LSYFCYSSREEVIDFEVNSKKSTQKPIWNNTTNNRQLLNYKDDDVKNIKAHALQLRSGRSNKTTLGLKKKWSIYNVLKNEIQKQLKKYDNFKYLFRPTNDQNRIAIGFVKSNDLNKSIQSENNDIVQMIFQSIQ